MFYCRSVSHHRAPLAVREQCSLTMQQQVQWLQRVDEADAVLLATCNRLELYADVPSPQHMDRVWADLLSARGLAPKEMACYVVSLEGFEAALHLFRVACGLESLALGEPQILGQVTHAYHHAEAIGASGSALSLLFRSAIHAAKRVRTETGISNGAASVSSLGIARAEEVAGPLAERAIVVLGAGEMGQTIVKALAQRGLSQITIVSRTFDTARTLAAHWGVAARPITELKDALIEADVLFTTSSAPFIILTQPDLAPVMAQRPDRPLCIVDIAVPRDVDPSTGELPGVCLTDLDDLQYVIDTNFAERKATVPQVDQIIAEELDRFWQDYNSRTIAPTIRLLRERAERLRQSELDRVYHRLPQDDAQARALFDQFSHRFMNKMLHQLTLNLKARAAEDDGAELAAVARELFGLEEGAV